jgi:hemolysin activation/secretion protein
MISLISSHFLAARAVRRRSLEFACACMALPGAVHAQQSAPPVFAVYEYVVDGNSLLSDAAIEASVTPFLGERRNLQDVEGARAALEKTYHDAGYLTVLVAIPEQSVDGGTVALHVVEAGVEKLSVKGAQYTLPSGIKAQVPELAEGTVPNFNKVQEQLAAVNRNGNLRVTPILRAGAVPGTVEVQLDADDQLPLHGSVEVSNRQTPNTTAERVTASLRYENLWQRGHSFGLTAQVAPQRPADARVLAGNYAIPVGAAGGSVMLSAIHSRSELASLASAPGLGLLGNSDIVGLRYSLPLAGSGTFGHFLSAGLDHKRIGQSLLVQEGGNTRNDISYTPAALSYTMRQNLPASVTSLDLGLSAGLRGLFGNRDDAFNAKRLGASASFLALRASLAHTARLGDWALVGRLDSQAASGPLVSSEQFTAGGAESVRGYLEGERAGDAGVRASVEVQTPAWRPLGTTSDWALAALVFYDAARVSTLQTLAPQHPRDLLRGTGFGVRVGAPFGLSLEVDAAHALADGETTRAGDNRVHARARWGY